MPVIKHLEFEQTGYFSKLFLDYLAQKPELRAFYSHFPDKKGFAEHVHQRSYPEAQRSILVSALQQQYAEVPNKEPVMAQIEALNKPNTFTVCTGHQLCLFTGPLYFVYKIVTTITLARTLQTWFPDHNFVPVFWMATEDHDAEEINHCYLFHKKLVWETNQTGAVGRFSLEGMEAVFTQLQNDASLLRELYSGQANLAAATRSLVHHIFGRYGLVCLDADTPALKQLFIPNIELDICKQTSFKHGSEVTEKLEQLGYEKQLHVRELNHFYLKDQLRERIVKNENTYAVTNTNITFTEQEIQTAIRETPECFSPNAALRPLYQECILPNIAYIGGPAEIAYWLQLKGIFEAQNVSFPLLVPRNFGLHLSKPQIEKLAKLEVQPQDLFQPENALKSHYLQLHQLADLQLAKEEKALHAVIDLYKNKAIQVDASLAGYIESERKELEKLAERIHKKLKKAAELKEEQQITQLLNLKNKLFPDQNLQERHDNFLNIYLQNPDFIETLLHIFDPLNFKFIIYSVD